MENRITDDREMCRRSSRRVLPYSYHFFSGRSKPSESSNCTSEQWRSRTVARSPSLPSHCEKESSLFVSTRRTTGSPDIESVLKVRDDVLLDIHTLHTVRAISLCSVFVELDCYASLLSHCRKEVFHFDVNCGSCPQHHYLFTLLTSVTNSGCS